MGGRKREVYFSFWETTATIRAGVAGIPVVGVPADASGWERWLYRLLLTSVKWGRVQGQRGHSVAQAARLVRDD